MKWSKFLALRPEEKDSWSEIECEGIRVVDAMVNWILHKLPKAP